MRAPLGVTVGKLDRVATGGLRLCAHGKTMHRRALSTHGGTRMYQFSRAIYRELSPRVIVEDRRDPTGCRNKRAVLDACETVVCRLVRERHFARPERWLFREVRPHFRVNDQLYVWRVIKGHVGLAIEFISRHPELATV